MFAFAQTAKAPRLPTDSEGFWKSFNLDFRGYPVYSTGVAARRPCRGFAASLQVIAGVVDSDGWHVAKAAVMALQRMHKLHVRCPRGSAAANRDLAIERHQTNWQWFAIHWESR